MTVTTHEPDSDDAADDDLAAERAGQSATAEEAMDAGTEEEGFADESAYTPSAVDQQDDLGSQDSAVAASPPERTDDVTTLAKMNDTPSSPDDAKAAAGERADAVTLLARANGNPLRQLESEALTEVVIPEVAILDRARQVESHADGATAVLNDVGQATGVRTPELNEATEPVRPTMIR
jgi:hypothetical protein